MPSAGEVASVVIVALIFATAMSRTTLETITSEVATVGGRSAATTISPAGIYPNSTHPLPYAL
jgi:hypothetical protein